MALREIDAQTALNWLKSNQIRIIDVREPAEFGTEHISGAMSLPLGKLAAVALAPQPGEKLLLVCASGRRSGMGCARLAAEGLEAYTLTGGLSAWKRAGGMVERGQRSVIPLERQVLLVAGFLGLMGVILSLLVHPWFIALSAMVGAGQMTAGLTGFCGMALLLGRAPWNQKSSIAAN